MKRLLSHAEVTLWLAAQRRRQRAIGFTCGAFDLLHAGHAAYLEKAAGLCDRLLVAVNSDASIRRYKNPLRPIHGEQHRLRLVAALRCVDAVTLLEQDRPVDLIRRWRPDVYIKGGDYRPEQLRSAPAVEAYGGRVAVVPIEEPVSTTAVIRRIAAVGVYAPPSVCAAPSRLIFLDRDGTLIEDVPHLRDPGRVRLLPGVGEGLARLQRLGFALVIVTNQQSLGLGLTTHDEFVAVNQSLLRQVGAFGVRISRIYYCPHALGEQCGCRKPSAELLRRALADYQMEARACYFVGNASSDMAAARAAGSHGVLVSPASGFEEAVRQIAARAALEISS